MEIGNWNCSHAHTNATSAAAARTLKLSGFCHGAWIPALTQCAAKSYDLLNVTLELMAIWRDEGGWKCSIETNTVFASHCTNQWYTYFIGKVPKGCK